MKLFQDLSLAINPLKDNFIFPCTDKSWGVWKYNRQDILSEELMTWAKLYNLINAHALLFYFKPGASLPTHIDIGNDSAWAFNWNLGNDVNMTWYETVDFKTTSPVQDSAPTFNGETLIYKPYKQEEIVKTLDCVKIGAPFMVKIGIPHSASNTSDKESWLLSVRFKDARGWETSIDNFKKYIVDK